MIGCFAGCSTRRYASCLELIPQVPGVYLFALGADAPGRELLRDHGPPSSCLLYVGASDDGLRRRLKCHLKDDSSTSSMRGSLGLLLRHALGLKVRPVGRERYFWFTGEAMLTEWLLANTELAFIPHSNPFVLEDELIRAGVGWLNIKGRANSPMALKLRRLRAEARIAG